MNPISKFTPNVRRERTEPAHVYCRLRPLKNELDCNCIQVMSADTLILTTPIESKTPRKEIQAKFQHIFTGNSTQGEIFQQVALPMLDDLLRGKNSLLFTYGVTGSGKTYTLCGNPEKPGIVPKSIYTIFNSVGHLQTPKSLIKPDNMNGFEIQSQEEVLQDKFDCLRSARKTPRKVPSREQLYKNDGIKILEIDESNLYSIFVSYVEIYNNTVYDLLDESNGKNSLQTKILREDSQKNMYVFGVTEVEVKSAAEAFGCFNLGQKRKKMGNTNLNSLSSRSHSMFNIRVVQFKQVTYNDAGQAVIPETNVLKISQLSLVDLAGSERTNRTQNTGQLLKEASQINNSLLTLRTCLDTLRENQITGSNKLIPYRDSRLTLYFKNYFEGGGHVAMIVCMNPSIDDFEENIQIVKFAETTRSVKVAPSETRFTPYKRHVQNVPITGDFIKFTLDIPKIKFDLSSMEENKLAVQRLYETLQHNLLKTKEFYESLDKKDNHFRKRLLEFDQDYTLKDSEVKRLKVQVSKGKQRCANVEAKLAESETAGFNLNRKLGEFQQEVATLRHTLAEKDMKISRNVLEKERVKQRMALQSERMTQELDAKLRRQREHLNAAMRAKESKIQKVKEIIEGDVTPPMVISEEEPVETPVVPVLEPRKVPFSTPSTRRRRSRSAGDVWLEHNAVKPVPLGTVLQPSIKKLKSVTKLSKAKDVTNPKQSKYCLIAQNQDEDGDIETKVYKADIVQTIGGGAQVIFNDVERLRQESPTANK